MSGRIGGFVCEDFQALPSYIYLDEDKDGGREIKSFLTEVSLSVWLASFHEQKLNLNYEIINFASISREECQNTLGMDL